MANINAFLSNIKNALYGVEVRSSIHDGIEAINLEVEETTEKQNNLENVFDNLIINAGNSNAEIVEARVTKNGVSYSKLSDRLNNIDTEVDNSKKQSKSQRRFSPTFGISPWFVSTTTEENNKKHIDKYAELGCEEIPFIVHVCRDENGFYYASEDIQRHLNLYSYIKEKGMNVNLLKFHVYTGLNKEIINSDIDDFFFRYGQIVQEWCLAFEGKIEYCTVLNEVDYIYHNDNNIDNITTLINYANENNFKTSFSLMGENEYFKINDILKDQMDFIGVNVYPKISEKGVNASMIDSLNAWNDRVCIFEELSKTGKEIIITETGVQHYYECLSNPGRWDWNNISQTNGYGKVANIFNYGLFESEIQNYISKVYYWYYDSLYYDECKEMILKYIGGGY